MRIYVRRLKPFFIRGAPSLNFEFLPSYSKNFSNYSARKFGSEIV